MVAQLECAHALSSWATDVATGPKGRSEPHPSPVTADAVRRSRLARERGAGAGSGRDRVAAGGPGDGVAEIGAVGDGLHLHDTGADVGRMVELRHVLSPPVVVEHEDITPS